MPEIEPAALRKAIQSGRLGPVYVLHGDDVRQMEQMMDAIEATVDEADRPFAVERVYAGEAGGAPIDIAAAANVFPMLGSRRVVTVLRAERLLKPPRAAKATDGQEGAAGDAGEATSTDEEAGAVDTVPLEQYIEKPSPTSVLVFVATAIDKSRRLTKAVVKHAEVIEFGGLSGDNAAERQDARREAIAALEKQFQAAGRVIDRPAIQMLVERAGGDISKLRDDVERLLLFTEGHKQITRADVEEVVTAESDSDDWALVNAIGDGNPARALGEVGVRFERGDSPFPLMGQLRWWVSTQLARAAPERVKPAIDLLLRTDLALKSSPPDRHRMLVERLIVELTGQPVRSAWGPGRR